MSRWPKVKKERREQIFRYNEKLASDSQAARDMQEIADRIGQMPKGQRKKLLDDAMIAILARYGVEV